MESKTMKIAVNIACIPALLWGAVVFAVPTFAANTPVGVSTSTGVSTSGDLQTPDLGNNAGSVNLSTQRSGSHKSKKATAGANKPETETNRQLHNRRTSTIQG
jgi:hypothetical protein